MESAFFLGGNINWLVSNVLYELAGGQGQFQTYFQVQDGQVVLREGADLSQANSGVQLLVELVQSNENYLFFADTNGATAADLFQGSRDSKGRQTQMGKSLANRFNGSISQTGGVGYLLGTSGRPTQLQPANLANGDPVFSVIAYNTNLVQTQVGIDASSIFPGAAPSPEVRGQMEGMGHIIRPVSFFIHEAAENRKFEEIGPKYETAHHHAIRREGIIRQELRIGGGFAGAVIQSVVKKP
ncbi:MAG TPA: hypothetical protein PLB18_23820 [Acidobacteriota bacterium]|nr:hypothetical protein [Acidobacteriota bacterium]